MVTIKSKREIELMREAGRVVAIVYDELEKHIKPGITTLELDQIAEQTMRKLGAEPAAKGSRPCKWFYRGNVKRTEGCKGIYP